MSEKPICIITHRQIIEGVCPWCESHVKHGQVIANSNAPANTEWDWNAVAESLRGEDREVRSQTAAGLPGLAAPLEKLLPLLAISLADSDPQVRLVAEHACNRAGRGVSVEQIKWLEEQTCVDSVALASRIVLLGVYFSNRGTAVRARRAAHIFWIIEHHPECGTAGSPQADFFRSHDATFYQTARELWLTQCVANRSKAAVPANAASFFLLREPQLAEKLLLNAQTIEPDNPQWHVQLAQLYQLSAISGSEELRQRKARQALVELEMAEQLRSSQAGDDSTDAHTASPEELDLSQSLVRLHTLPERAKAAFAAGELKFAREFAEECLALASSAELPEFFRRNGNAIHYSHLVLGRIALREGNLEQAKTHLIESGKTQESPNLNSFGPDMSLAEELLERGERETVLEYLDLCGKFWKLDGGRLEVWKQHIARQNRPEFGACLNH